MNRREALKKLGVTFGLVMTGPALFRSYEVNGFSNMPPLSTFKPQFFTQDQFNALIQAVDVILPETDSSPSASQVGVPQYIDSYVDEVVSLEEQPLIRDYVDRLAKRSRHTPMEELVEKSLNASEEEEKELYEQIDTYTEAKRNGEEVSISDDAAIFSIMHNLRDMCISSYKNSEYIGEQVLAYDPIPGEQRGCVSVKEATGGKAWSL